MSRPLRVAVSGAGRVFERLYAPALRMSPSIELVALAEPHAGRAASAWPGVPVFPALGVLLAQTAVDAVIVLSPPHAHLEDALAALARRLPVLVEKPMCVDAGEVAALRDAGAQTLLTPAFSRRYWPAYRRIAAVGASSSIRFALRVDPAGWDAHGGPTPLLDDLFPHVADLARWLTRGELLDVEGRASAYGVEASMRTSAGVPVTARIESGREYREAARVDGRTIRVGPPSIVASALRRMARRPDPAVAAVRAMLTDWAQAIEGSPPASLPRFEDGAASVLALETLRGSLTGAANP